MTHSTEVSNIHLKLLNYIQSFCGLTWVIFVISFTLLLKTSPYTILFVARASSWLVLLSTKTRKTRNLLAWVNTKLKSRVLLPSFIESFKLVQYSWTSSRKLIHWMSAKTRLLSSVSGLDLKCVYSVFSLMYVDSLFITCVFAYFIIHAFIYCKW